MLFDGAADLPHNQIERNTPCCESGRRSVPRVAAVVERLPGAIRTDERDIAHSACLPQTGRWNSGHALNERLQIHHFTVRNKCRSVHSAR